MLSGLVILLIALPSCNCLGSHFSMPDVCLRLKFSGKFQPHYSDHFQERGESKCFAQLLEINNSTKLLLRERRLHVLEKEHEIWPCCQKVPFATSRKVCLILN